MEDKRGVRLFWPIILIGVGAILLLSNLGVIHGNPWTIMLQLWPVLLIALGLEILFGGSTGWRAVVSALLGLALVGGILWILVAQPAIPGLNFGASNLQTTNVSQPLNGVESARADLSFGAGTSKVYALSDSSNLIEGQLADLSLTELQCEHGERSRDDCVGAGACHYSASDSIFLRGNVERWLELNGQLSAQPERGCRPVQYRSVQAADFRRRDRRRGGHERSVFAG